MKRFISFAVLLLTLVVLFSSCNNEKEHSHEEGSIYTCPMHPQIIKDEPGNCPICGMALVKKEQNTNAAAKNDSLGTLAGPTDEIIMSSLPLTTLEQSEEGMEIKVFGLVQHDNRHIYTLSSRISGRIEKLYVRYRYQYIGKGQKIFEIYSPDLLTGQQNLIFLYKSDPNNHSLISAARQRLLLLGMNGQQLAHITRTGKPLYSVAIYSPTSGYVTEAGFNSNMDIAAGNSSQEAAGNSMSVSTPTTTIELPIKEGMYVDKAQPLFTVIDARHGRISLSIFADGQNLVKGGTPVMIIPDTAPAKKFRATIDRIEPFYEPGSKTLSARVYFNNATLRLPMGSQVQATIFTSAQKANWLPASAVITTGLSNVVYKKEAGGFTPKVVTTGLRNNGKVQIISGLSQRDSVVVNAQYLNESESIINVKEQR